MPNIKTNAEKSMILSLSLSRNSKLKLFSNRSHLKLALVVFCAGFFVFGMGISHASAATAIYRSVSPTDTSNHNPNNYTVEISGTTATFSNAMPDNIGVGDVLQYNISGTYYLAFISGRTSSTVYTVQAKDGTTPQVAPLGQVVSVFRAYTSLANSIAQTENTAIDTTVRNFDISKDLVTPDYQWNIACYANGTTGDSGVVAISGYSTNVTAFINVYTPYLETEVGTSQRHGGKWDTTKYLVQGMASSDYYSLIQIGSAYTKIQGLQISITASAYISIKAIYINASSNVGINANIIKGSITNGAIVKGIYTTGASTKIYNNIVYGFVSSSYGIQAEGNPTYIYNNTLYGNGQGIYTSYNYSVAKNNISYGNTADYAGTFNSASTNNVSSDATAPGSNKITSAILSFINTTAGSENLHLAVTDAAAKGTGTNLSSDTYLPFMTDIDGDSRPSSGEWDIGADEYISNGSYTIGGTISGLSGSITLQNNEGDSLTKSSDGTFVFDTPLLSGASYSVTVSSQPSGQICIVTSGTGTVGSADITNVSVSCPAMSIVLTKPKAYQVIQRDTDNKANILIAGTYSGSPSAIEVSWDGGAYTTIDASPSGGVFSGTLSNQTAGQGTLIARFVNNTSISTLASYVGIGDVFVIYGQSNSDGRGPMTSVSPSSSGVIATFDSAGVSYATSGWAPLVDGNYSPYLAQYLLQANPNVPIGFVKYAIGGTAISSLVPGGAYFTTLTNLLDSAVGDQNNLIRGILYYQGETDAQNCTASSTYAADLQLIISSLVGSYGGVGMVGVVGTDQAPTRNCADAIREAQLSMHSKSNNVPGAVIVDDRGDGLHYSNVNSLAQFGYRWF